MSDYYNRGNYYRPSMFGGFSFFPPVIKGLIITNTAVFILTSFFGSFHWGNLSLREVLYEYFALMPIGNGFYPWQLITYQFMHAGLLHLLGNMIFGLWMFGMEVEHVWGSRKFLFYYLFCGTVGGIAQLLLAPALEPAQSLGPVVGASGAIFGVMIAFAVMYPDRYIFFYFLVPIKSKYFVIGYILLNLFAIGDGGAVAVIAHLGGAVAGYSYLMYDMRRVPLSDAFDRVRYWWNSRTIQRTRDGGMVDAKVYDLSSGRETKPDDRGDAQKHIDQILDKISRSGYQSLTEEEKRLLFEASKKLN